ncbi:putative reverse transcriptase domain-containing protein [Tanacetum coccineum]
MVCQEKVVRIPLEGDEIRRVHDKRTQGVVKTLMNTKVDELKLSDISIVQDFIDVFPEDLSMTTAMTKEEHGVHLRLELELLRKKKLYAKSSVKDKILATPSETSKVENAPADMLHDLDQQMEKRADDGLHPGADKTYYNLGDMYWWSCIRKVIAIYVSKFRTCLRGEGCNVKDFWLAATA